MADVLTAEQRSYCMSRIRGKDTNPELIVRKILHALGYRYRLHDRSLPGSPDLVFPGKQKVLFVHGCFWHRHNCRYGRVIPKTRRAFWQRKLDGNRQRDKKNRQLLRNQGWNVLVVWECQLRKQDWLLERLCDFLDGP